MTATQHGPVRIFLTIRPVQPLEAVLSSAQWSTFIHTVSLDTSSQETITDVMAFIRESFAQINGGPELLAKRGDIA